MEKRDILAKEDRWDTITRRFRGTSFQNNIKSTLDFPTYKPGRRAGNTTRQINQGIEHIFNGGVIICEDHHEAGTNVMANNHLHRRLMDRVRAEHQWDFKNIKTDRNLLYVYLEEPLPNTYHGTDQETT